MRIFLDIGLLVAVILGVLVIVGTCSAEGAERRKIYDDGNRQVGDIYCPKYQNRCQVRDNDRRIKYYIEKDGTITDTRRRKVKEIELPQRM